METNYPTYHQNFEQFQAVLDNFFAEHPEMRTKASYDAYMDSRYPPLPETEADLPPPGEWIVKTPWGPSQKQKMLATGITFYHTASHGGYHLSQRRFSEMPDVLRAARRIDEGDADAQWFEEDCDWCLVCLGFPEYFDGETCAHAINTARFWSDKNADHYPGWKPWMLDVDDYLTTTAKGRMCATRAKGHYQPAFGKPCQTDIFTEAAT